MTVRAIAHGANGLSHGWNLKTRDILFQPLKKE